jgi:HK97 family phage major capsid protein
MRLKEVRKDSAYLFEGEFEVSPIERIREEIRKLLEKRSTFQEQMDELLSGVEERDDKNLSEQEETIFNQYRDSIKELDEKRTKLEASEKEMQVNEEARNAALEAQKKYGKGDTKPTSGARVTNEPVTYRLGGDHSFVFDAMMRSNDPEARERIERNQKEGMARLRAEGRDVGTSAFGALVVPQYLTDMYAEVVRAGRPLLNAVNNLALPPQGMTLNIPRGTTGTVVASQSDQGDAVTSVDFDETTLVVPVVTIAGQQNLSRQAIDRGTGVDQIIMQDLASAYATQQDNQAINGDGSNGTYAGILSTTGVTTVTYANVAATTTAAALHSKVADAIQRINSTRYMAPTLIVMHPRRWGYLTSATDTTGRPLVVPNVQAPQNAIGVGEAAGYGQIVGVMLGLPVMTDANVPTTVSTWTGGGAQDVVIVTRAPDLHLWENTVGPTTVEFRETLAGNLQVKVVAHGYSAFTAERWPTATAVVSGSSLGTPTF